MSKTRNIIQSVKNQFGQDLSIIGGAVGTVTVATTVEVGSPTKVIGVEVPIGAYVYGLELWVQFVGSSGTVTANYKWFIAKARQGQDLLLDFPSPDFTDIGLSNVRNQIFHSESNLVGTEDAGPYRFHRHLNLPKNMQRFRAGDTLFVKSLSDVAGVESINFIYKYYQ